MEEDSIKEIKDTKGKLSIYSLIFFIMRFASVIPFFIAITATKFQTTQDFGVKAVTRRLRFNILCFWVLTTPISGAIIAHENNAGGQACALPVCKN